MIKITETPFNPWNSLEKFQNNLNSIKGKFGACNSFIGFMRDFNDNTEVKAMSLEHYPGMTEKQLEAIVDEAAKQWEILEYLIIHRVGELAPNEPIVLVAIWSSHRGDAFDACRYIMEALKSKAPFWKKETLLNDKQRWVNQNTDGYKNFRNS